jgi:hypothetical protein
MLGDTSHALDLLDQAVRDHDALVVDFKVDPTLDAVRSRDSTS